MHIRIVDYKKIVLQFRINIGAGVVGLKVIVVGTGIAGASAAYQLEKAGVDVTMIDRVQEGKATSAGAGIVCPWISSVENPDWYRIAKRGAAFYPSLIESLQADGETETGYKKVGALSVSTSMDILDSIEQRVREKQKTAPELGDIRRLNKTETQNYFPMLADELEAVYVSGAARVDGRFLREALKNAAQKHGAQLIQGTAGLKVEKGQVTGVVVEGAFFEADAVLLTAGAWAPELLKDLGLELHIEPQRGQIAHIKLSNQDTSSWPVVLPQTSYYMLAFDDSRVVAGATRETGSGFDHRLTAGGVHEILQECLEIAPGLQEGTLQEIRIGFRPMGPDILPLIGSINKVKGLYIANGLGASGLTMGPYVGALVSKLIMGESLSIDLRPYDPMRAIITKPERVN